MWHYLQVNKMNVSRMPFPIFYIRENGKNIFSRAGCLVSVRHFSTSKISYSGIVWIRTKCVPDTLHAPQPLTISFCSFELNKLSASESSISSFCLPFSYATDDTNRNILNALMKRCKSFSSLVLSGFGIRKTEIHIFAAVYPGIRVRKCARRFIFAAFICTSIWIPKQHLNAEDFW